MNQNVLVICALTEELTAIKEELGNAYKVKNLGRNIKVETLIYSMAGCTIFVTESGMGNVNAGVNLAIIINDIEINEIILIGVGGALTHDLKIGDLVLSNTVVQHDYFSSLESGEYLMKPGDLILSDEDYSNYNPFLVSCESSFNLEKIKKKNPNSIISTVASGSEFVANPASKKEIFEKTNGATLVDMEASAIAHVAIKAGIPFTIAKTVSDKLNPDGTIEEDFLKFLKAASSNAAAVISTLVGIIDE